MIRIRGAGDAGIGISLGSYNCYNFGAPHIVLDDDWDIYETRFVRQPSKREILRIHRCPIIW
jgi:hypothetical protein